ncbi:uncharacterized protein LOC112093283 [Morus notabilis]|uniref:uncharacterized protein LOC112093283 n=1 Tax=Morus notabilis TaxID=981085 RepID=UPI000CED3481|nr:uncharacterized protein LOC112093283 [Morus notabilis]
MNSTNKQVKSSSKPNQKMTFKYVPKNQRAPGQKALTSVKSVVETLMTSFTFPLWKLDQTFPVGKMHISITFGEHGSSNRHVVTVNSNKPRTFPNPISRKSKVKEKEEIVIQEQPEENEQVNCVSFEESSSNELENRTLESSEEFINIVPAPPGLEDGGQATVDELKKINLATEEDPKPVFVSALLTAQEQSYEQCLREYRDVFAWSYKDMPGLDPEAAVHKLAVSNDVQCKKNGQIRICVDYRNLNNACPNDEFPLPITVLLVDATTGFGALSFMDGFSGYNQIKMAPEDEELTALRTPRGIYCYTMMPFRLKNAGVTYQMTMTVVFDDMLHNTVECYVDDLEVKTKEMEYHLNDLKRVFDRLRQHQVKMNPLK